MKWLLQLPQKMRPQILQWCRLTNTLKAVSHS
jgi:hypothetical protein